MAQVEEMKKTPNVQRLTLNIKCSSLTLPLSVGRWALDVGRFLLL